MAFAQATITAANSGGNVTSQVINLPDNLAANDLVIVTVVIDGTTQATFPGSPAWSTPTGVASGEVASDSHAQRSRYRRVDGTEGWGGTGNSITVTCPSETLAWTVALATGAHTTTAPASVEAFDSANSANPNPSGLDPADWGVEDTLWMVVYGWDGAASNSAYPASYTNNQTTSAAGGAGGVGIAAATRELAAASENPGTATVSAAGEWTAQLIAVRPAPAGLTGALARVASTDVARALTAGKATPIARVASADAARAITEGGGEIVQPISRVASTDAARAVTAVKVKALGRVAEVDAARAVTAQKLRAIARSAEVDAARTLTSTKAKAIGRVAELDAARPLTAGKAVVVARVASVDAARALGPYFAYSIAAGSDDAKEAAGGVTETTQASSGTIDAGTWLGLRFAGLPVPQGAQIDSAVVRQVLTDNDKNDAEGTWRGHDVDNSPTFTESLDGDVDSRVTTTASVAWTTNDLGGAGTEVSSPELATVVQEIVDRAGWSSGNALTLLYEHASATDKLELASFEHATLQEPRLLLRWTPPSGLTVARVAELDVARSLTVAKVKAIGRVAELDAARAITAAKTRALVRVAELDAARAVTTAKAKALARIAELDAARSLTTAKARAVVRVAELDVARVVAPSHVRAIARIAEADVARAVTFTKQKAITRAAEVDVARAIGVGGAVIIQRIATLVVARAVTAEKLRAITRAAEVDTARPIITAKVRELGRAAEVDVARALTTVILRTIARAAEVDVARTLIPSGGLPLIPTVQFTVTVGPTRSRAQFSVVVSRGAGTDLTVEASRLGMDVADTRSRAQVAASPTRERPRGTVAAVRSRAQVDQVGPTRQGLEVGPSRDGVGMP